MKIVARERAPTGARTVGAASAATLLFVLLAGCASTPRNSADSLTALDQELTTFLAHYAEAYNRQDYVSLLQMWDADDANVLYIPEEIDPPMHGWPAICAYFNRPGVLEGLRNEYSNLNAHYIAPDIALATYQLHFTIKVRDLKPFSTSDRIVAVFRRKNGEWKMAAYVEAPQAPLNMARLALKTSKSLDATQQKELLRTIYTLMEDAVPEDFDEWLEKQQAQKARP